MSHMIPIGTSEEGPVKLDVDRLVVSRLLATAASGGGKSHLLRKILEGLSKTTQTIVFDTEGEFATLREARDMVLAGPAGEVPADPRSASLLCRRLMELNLSAVIDVSDLARSAKRDFVTQFINTLVDLPRGLWRPCAVAVDEVHEYAAEGEKSESGKALSLLASKGRKRGYCLLGATQRLQKLDKDVAAELKNVFIGQMSLDVDLRRAADLLGMGKDRWSEIRDLSPPGREGEFFCFGPALNHRGVIKFRGGAVETTHPKAGQGRLAEPPAPSQKIQGVLGELKDLPQQAEAEIRDLSAARQKIATLERELKAAQSNWPPAVAPQQLREAQQQARANAGVVARLKKGLEDAMKVIAEINAKGFDKTGIDPELVAKAVQAAAEQIVRAAEQRLTAREREFNEWKTRATKLLAELQKLIGEDVKVSVAVQHNEPFTVAPPAPARRAAPTSGPSNGDAGTMSEGAPARILAALARAPDGLTDRKLAARAGVSRKKSTYRNAMTDLRKQGYLGGSGDLRTLTDSGVEAAAHVPPLPTGQSLIDHYRREMGEGAPRRIFEVLLEAGGSPLTKAEVADRAGIDLNTSTFRNAMTDLRTWDIVDGSKELKLSDELVEAIA